MADEAGTPAEAASDAEDEVIVRRFPPAWLVTGLGRLVVGSLTLVLVVTAVVSAAVYPYFRDDMKLDRAVRAAALDWRDFGKEKGQTRLAYELDHEAIGLQVRDSNCQFAEESNGSRVIECAWSVQIAVPGLVGVPLAFASRAEILPDGDLR